MRISANNKWSLNRIVWINISVIFTLVLMASISLIVLSNQGVEKNLENQDRTAYSGGKTDELVGQLNAIITKAMPLAIKSYSAQIATEGIQFQILRIVSGDVEETDELEMAVGKLNKLTSELNDEWIESLPDKVLIDFSNNVGVLLDVTNDLFETSSPTQMEELAEESRVIAGDIKVLAEQLKGQLIDYTGLSEKAILVASREVTAANADVIENEKSLSVLLGRINLFTPLILGLIIVLVIGAQLVFFRVFKNRLSQVKQFVEEVAAGDLDSQIDLKTNDDLGNVVLSLRMMQSTLKANRENDKTAQVIARIKQALDVCGANIMLVDADGEVIYINDSVREMMLIAETDIRVYIPSFRVSDLIGMNIQELMNEVESDNKYIWQSESILTSRVKIADRSYNLMTTPVFGNEGRLGTVAEWEERTDEIAIQKEIEDLVLAAREGDLSKSINLENKTGFFLDLSKGMNDLLQTVDTVFSEIATVMSAMSKGELLNKMSGNFTGTYGDVQQNVNSTIGSLLEIIGNIRSSSDKISSGSEEISAGNNSLSSRTERQAESLEETSSAMAELTSTVQQSAESAANANSLSNDAQNIAGEGTQIVRNAIGAMEEINTASNKISEIVNVIDEIAFQTNLLALNASVEAARAGDQGRGFAVVATEVRNLAQRSATSAREIKELILDSVQKVEIGSELVNKSGEALENIMAAVVEVGDIVGEISKTSSDQANSIEQINLALTNLDELTNKNAALAEETSAASVSMRDYASSMGQQVEFFKIDNQAIKRIPSGSGASKVSQFSNENVDDQSNKKQEKVFEFSPLKKNGLASAPVDNEWEEF